MIPHDVLLEQVYNECVRNNWKVESQAVVLSENGSRMAASFTLDIPDSGIDYLLSIGLLNSNDRRRGLRFYFGVIDEEAGVVLSVTKARKHTKNKDVYEEAIRLGQCFKTRLQLFPLMIGHLKHTRLTGDEVCSLVVEAARKNLIPWSRLKVFDQEIRSTTGWGVLVSFGKAVSRNPPLGQLDQLYGFYVLLAKMLRDKE